MDIEAARTIATLERRVKRLETNEVMTGLESNNALMRTIHFLNGRRGVRYINRGAMGANAAVNAPVTLMDVVGYNAAHPMWQIDSTRFFPYLDLDKATYNQYMYNYYSAWGLWGPDTGVYDGWNSAPGVTAGAWMKLNSYSTPEQGVLSGWNEYSSDPGYGASWRMMVDTVTNTYKLRANVSNTGSYDANQEALTSNDVPLNRWVFGVLRWTPSTSLEIIMYDGDTVDVGTDSTGITSSLFSAKYLYHGGYKRSTNVVDSFNGQMGVAFFHVSAFSDDELTATYQMSRHIYGV
jgi:hypothetical protein